MDNKCFSYKSFIFFLQVAHCCAAETSLSKPVFFSLSVPCCLVSSIPDYTICPSLQRSLWACVAILIGLQRGEFLFFHQLYPLVWAGPRSPTGWKMQPCDPLIIKHRCFGRVFSLTLTASSWLVFRVQGKSEWCSTWTQSSKWRHFPCSPTGNISSFCKWTMIRCINVFLIL